MKRNTLLLTSVSLVLGLVITLGLTHVGTTRFAKLRSCPDNKLAFIDCGTWNYGYPVTYLHSNVGGYLTQASNGNGTDHMVSTAWIEFKPAATDWLIWSAVSAGGLGLLIYLLERAGVNTGFVEKRSKRRR